MIYIPLKIDGKGKLSATLLLPEDDKALVKLNDGDLIEAGELRRSFREYASRLTPLTVDDLNPDNHECS